MIVCIDPLDGILLQSVGYGPRCGLSKPSDFIEAVTRLQRTTDRDGRTRSRCFAF
jgi:hypothetical protein